MYRFTFDRAANHVQLAILASPLRSFAVPHLVIDNVLPDDLVGRINENWPEYREGFTPEVPGNHIFRMFRRNYQDLAGQRLEFWQSFNEVLWPVLVGATAEALAGPASEVFGDLFYKHLSLDENHPLTLMQADPTYPGHSLHQHFYHCPNWAFTMLLYIDPDDRCSRGTGIHCLLPRGDANARREGNESQTSYLTDDLDWRVEVAMDTQHWLDPLKPDRSYRDQVVDYKANRLLVFLDGPLALHSVPFDNADHTPDPARARDGGRHARRRILRSHVKVNHAPFFRKHSQLLPEPIDRVSYMRLMGINPVLSAEEKRYRNEVLVPFFKERLQAYAKAAARTQKPAPTAAKAPPRFWDRIVGRSPSAGDQFKSQLIQRIP